MSRLAAVLGSRWVALRSPEGRKVGALATLDLAGEENGAYLASGLIAITLLLVGFGLLSVYSASSFTAQSEGLPDSYYLVQQAARALVGIAALLAASFVDYRVYRYLAWPLLAATAALLIIIILPGTEAIAPRINGARRWLMLGVTVQPSELAKIAIVIWTAALAVKKQERLRSLRYGLVPFLLVIGPVCLLILLEPHLSGAMLVGALAFIVLFAAGGRLGHFLFLAMLGLPVLWDQVANTGYRMNRMMAFMKPGMGADDIGYQLNQSLIAIGSGGPFGVGFGESRQKLLYLPEPQNDFIFSIIAEEWGLIGSVFLIPHLGDHRNAHRRLRAGSVRPAAGRRAHLDGGRGCLRPHRRHPRGSPDHRSEPPIHQRRRYRARPREAAEMLSRGRLSDSPRGRWNRWPSLSSPEPGACAASAGPGGSALLHRREPGHRGEGPSGERLRVPTPADAASSPQPAVAELATSHVDAGGSSRAFPGLLGVGSAPGGGDGRIRVGAGAPVGDSSWSENGAPGAERRTGTRDPSAGPPGGSGAPGIPGGGGA
jgi:cell division protein FtsW (lipid II flippase)